MSNNPLRQTFWRPVLRLVLCPCGDCGMSSARFNLRKHNDERVGTACPVHFRLPETLRTRAAKAAREGGMTDPVVDTRGRWTAQSIDAGRLRFVDWPYVGRTLAVVRAALRAAGVPVDEEAANEAMVRAFNHCEVRRGPEGAEVGAFWWEPLLH